MFGKAHVGMWTWGADRIIPGSQRSPLELNQKKWKVKGGESQRQLLTLTLSTKSFPSTAPSNGGLLRLSDMSLSQSLSLVVEVGMAGQGHGCKRGTVSFAGIKSQD